MGTRPSVAETEAPLRTSNSPPLLQKHDACPRFAETMRFALLCGNMRLGEFVYESVLTFVLCAGDRYFIIKSWTEENVFEAQERGYWSTQDKHTQLFEEAFHESRNVILFFSVNKSMAFQGVVSTSPFSCLPLCHTYTGSFGTLLYLDFV